MRYALALVLALVARAALAGTPSVPVAVPQPASPSNLAIVWAEFGDLQGLTNANDIHNTADDLDPSTCACETDCTPGTGGTCDPCKDCVGSWRATHQRLLAASVADAVAWGAQFALTVGDNIAGGHDFDRSVACSAGGVGAEVLEQWRVFREGFLDMADALGLPWIAGKGNHDDNPCYEQEVAARFAAKPWAVATALDGTNNGNSTQLQARFKVGRWNMCVLSVDCGITAAERDQVTAWVGCGASEPTIAVTHLGVISGGSCSLTSNLGNGQAACPSAAPNDALFYGGGTDIIDEAANAEIWRAVSGHYVGPATCFGSLTVTGRAVTLANGNLQDIELRRPNRSPYPWGATPFSSAQGTYTRCKILPLWDNGDGTRGRLQCWQQNPWTKNTGPLPAPAPNYTTAAYDAPLDWCARFGGCP